MGDQRAEVNSCPRREEEGGDGSSSTSLVTELTQWGVN